MITRLHRPLVVFGGVAVLIAALSACAGGAGSEPSAPSASPNTDTTQQAMVSAAWLDGGRMIGIVSQGSSTCVPVAGDVSLESDGTLTVALEDAEEDAVCTADFAPRVSLVTVPEGVDPAVDLELVVTGNGYEGNTVLPGVAGLVVEGASAGTPSAGWTDIDGTFVVLLWGSSGCPESIAGVEVTGDAAVEATLSGIPADKACTADLVPNAQLAAVDGLVGVENVQLTLIAALGDPATIPILGVNGEAP